MIPNEAKVILGLCPPEDETNPDVPRLGEARDFAAANPELAKWWEQEKNYDLHFSHKLSSLKPPPELLPTILRGGATIFYASRLIAETASEEADEPEALPNLLSSQAAADLAEVGRPVARNIVTQDVPEPRSARRWFWLMGLVLLAVVGLFGLFVFEYALASKEVAVKSHHAPRGEVAKIETIATDLPSSAAPATAAGQSLAEMKKILEDNNSPNPPELPPIVTQPPTGVVVNVTPEVWNFVPITHFTIQSGVNLSHLIIMKATDMHLKNVPVDDFSATRDAFNEQVWSTQGFIFIQLKPKQPHP